MSSLAVNNMLSPVLYIRWRLDLNIWD